MIQSHRTRVKPDALMTPAAWFLTAGDKDV